MKVVKSGEQRDTKVTKGTKDTKVLKVEVQRFGRLFVDICSTSIDSVGFVPFVSVLLEAR